MVSREDGLAGTPRVPSTWRLSASGAIADTPRNVLVSGILDYFPRQLECGLARLTGSGSLE